MTKRSIAAITIPSIAPKAAAGARPEVTWIKPTDILVEDRYQRGVGERGRKLIITIYGNFDWRLWRLPLCVWTEDGLEAIDGQHSLIAAASLGLAEVPVMIVDAPEIQNRAALFVNANKDRLAVTRLQMHAAAVLAGDSDALVVEQICNRLRIKILKATPFEGKYKPRETLAVVAITGLLKRYDAANVERMLAVVGNMDAAPVSVTHIKATELLLNDAEFADEIQPAEITAAALTLPDLGEQESKLFAATHRVPQWRALASVWFKAAKKLPKKAKVTALPVTASSLPSSSPSLIRRYIERPSPLPPTFGDPEPGRSVLDQRRAAL